MLLSKKNIIWLVSIALVVISIILFFIFNIRLINHKRDSIDQAINACRALPIGADCSFLTNRGQAIYGACTPVRGDRPSICR